MLGRGHAALNALTEWASEPAAQLRLLELVTSNPARLVSVYAAARRRTREFLDRLLEQADPRTIVAGVWEWLAGSPRPPEAVLRLARRATERTLSLAGEAGAEDGAASGQALLGLLAGRTGDPATAVELLTPLCGGLRAGTPPAGPGAPHMLECARELFAASRAVGDLAAGAAAVQALVVLGEALEGARRLAELLSAWPAGSDGRARLAGSLSRILAHVPAGELHAWLNEVWSAVLAGVSERRGLRRGYFAREMRLLESRVDEIAGLLSGDDPVAHALAEPEARELCALASARVAGLIGELVVYQPLRAEPVVPRQIALEVVVSSREELASDGLLATVEGNGGVSPGGPAPPVLPVTDPALVKSVLKQALLRLGGAARLYLARRGRERAYTRPAAAVAVAVAADAPAAGAGPPAAGFHVRATCHPAGSALAGGSRGEGESLAACLGAEVPGLIRDSTIEDALSRARGRMKAATALDGTAFELTFSFPSLPPAGTPRLSTQPPSGFPADLAASAGTPAGALRAAEFLLASHEAAVGRELTAWGEELAIVLHDLKNSLAFVAGWLRGTDLYDAQTVRQRSLESVEDVRFWLAEAGAMLSRPEGLPGPYTDVVASVRRVLRGLAAFAAQRQIRLEIDLPSAAALVPVESFRVASVVRNLAKNGLEASPAGSVLLVRVNPDRAPGMVEVVVRDAGPGFPPETTPGAGALPLGNGLSRPRLGLLSARRILGESGGRLVLENDGGGVATAVFPAGGGVARLAGRVRAWAGLSDEARRALRAAAAMSSAGNTEMARHLWRNALEAQASGLRESYTRHEFLPRASEMLVGKGKGRLTAGVTGVLASVFSPVNLPRAEGRAKSLLSAVIRGRLRPEDVSLEDLAVLALLQGVRSPDPRRLARSLSDAVRLLEDPSAREAEIEAAVLAALEPLASPGGPAGAGD